MQKRKFHKNPIKRGTILRDINHFFLFPPTIFFLSRLFPMCDIFKWKIYCFSEMCTCTHSFRDVSMMLAVLVGKRSETMMSSKYIVAQWL